jgi:hypothetical protein
MAITRMLHRVCTRAASNIVPRDRNTRGYVVHAVAIATGTRSVMHTPVKVAMISEGLAWRVGCGAVKQVLAINTAEILRPVTSKRRWCLKVAGVLGQAYDVATSSREHQICTILHN